MKNIHQYAQLILISVLFFSLSACNKFLDRPPMDRLENTPEFYNSEQNIRSSLMGLYSLCFEGYNSGWGRSIFGNQSTTATWSDDFAQKSVEHFTKQAPATSDAWDFRNLKKVNMVIQGIQNSTMEESAKNHWLGVARFFRAMLQSSLVRDFGDIPYYDKPYDNTQIKELFRPRDSRDMVMQKVNEDLLFAAKNVRESDGPTGLVVSRDVVNAFAAKIMLFEASWQKYHKNNNALAKTFFEQARTFAKAVMDTKKYLISDDYHALTTSVNLANNKEIIIYRHYEAGLVTHSVMSFDIEQPQSTSMSKSLVRSYRTTNGLPATQVGNTLYKGDLDAKSEFANRDPRLEYTIRTDKYYLENIHMPYAASGYLSRKFTNDALIGKADGQSSTNVIDAPVFRYAELLLIYAEATAEIGTLGGSPMTQADLDMSINTIRNRKDVRMPHLTLQGDRLSVGGIVIDDPERDPDVSPLLWEIRNERRVEMAMEGLRYDDLRRWKKLDKADMLNNPSINLGAYIDKDKIIAEYNAGITDDSKKLTLEKIKNLNLDRSGNKGYLKPVIDASNFRRFDPKHYLRPLPTNQITLYEEKAKDLGDDSIKLTQNPGW